MVKKRRRKKKEELFLCESRVLHKSPLWFVCNVLQKLCDSVRMCELSRLHKIASLSQAARGISSKQ